jgi:hypothetical protein
MLMLKILTIAGFLLIALPALAADTVYSTVLDDLPLMQGMTEKPDDTVIFVKPGGRIVEFSAETTEPATAVKDFYQHALPPLGWKAAQPMKFIRDKEELKIDFDKAGGETPGVPAGKTIVRFALTPVSGGK